ncbi:MAG: response regulator [Bacilli bacterium]
MKDVNVLLENGVNVKKSLELFGDMETYDQTLEVFLQEVDGKFKNIKNYKEIGDMANYAILVHSLKSDARYFGFEKLAEIAYKHELESKANNIYFVTDNFDALEIETKRVINLVKKYMGRSYEEASLKNVVVEKPEKAILVVDDSTIIRNFVEKIFKEDFEVLIANDGKEALDILNNEDERSRIKAILLDLNMPNVDGFQVLDYFLDKNLFKKFPVSIITGVDDKESINKAFKYPIVDMLLKPFNERDVKKILEKTINHVM